MFYPTCLFLTIIIPVVVVIAIATPSPNSNSAFLSRTPVCGMLAGV